MALQPTVGAVGVAAGAETVSVLALIVGVTVAAVCAEQDVRTRNIKRDAIKNKNSFLCMRSPVPYQCEDADETISSSL